MFAYLVLKLNFAHFSNQKPHAPYHVSIFSRRKLQHTLLSLLKEKKKKKQKNKTTLYIDHIKKTKKKTNKNKKIKTTTQI